MADVPFIDSSGAHAVGLLARKLSRKGGQLYVAGARSEVRQALIAGGAEGPLVLFVVDRSAVNPPAT